MFDSCQNFFVEFGSLNNDLKSPRCRKRGGGWKKSQFGARVTNLGNPLSATLVINFQFLVAKLAAWVRNDPIDI